MLSKKMLIVAICPKCKETIVIFTNTDTLHCRCGEHIPFTEMDLKNGQYICPNCGKAVYFKVLGQLQDLKCKTCESWVDFKWHVKFNKFVSLNMIK